MTLDTFGTDHVSPGPNNADPPRPSGASVLSAGRRRGSVLLLVLVVVAMLTLAGFGFSHLMFEHRRGTWAFGRQLQAEAMVESGAQLVLSVLGRDDETIQHDGGLFDNPELFRGVLVVDDATRRGRGRFSVLATRTDADQGSGVRYGLENESARINLNALLALDQQKDGAARRMLSALPEMTEEIADAILDWLDQDDQPRRFGAEANDYLGLDPPYAPKNGPLEAIEELLLVRGVTPELFFGADRNRNGILDADEMTESGTGSLPVDGWSRYLTLDSRERNLQPDGTPKINVNSSDLRQLYRDLEAALGKEVATFVVAYRQHGGQQAGGTDQPARAVQIDFAQKARQEIKTILDLIATQVRLPARAEGQPQQVLESPFSENRAALNEYLPELMDQLTVRGETTIEGRINLNLAPAVVLLGIPGMTVDMVDDIVATRDPEVTAERPGRRHATWILAEGIATLEQMKSLLPFVTAGGDVYRAQIVGYYEEGGPTARILTVISATTSPPRRLRWRNISRLGRGYSLELLGLD